MTLFDALVATISAEDGGVVEGRTLLQKKLYFLSVLTGERFGYEPYFYGPYSSDVTNEVETLVQAGLVEETSESLPVYTAPQFEPRLFKYKLTKAALEALPELETDLAPYRAALARINGHPVAKRAKPLSIAAKVHLISSGERGLSASEIRNRATRFGWTMDEREIRDATEYLGYLGVGVA